MSETTQEAVDANRAEAGVDPDSLGEAVISMTDALEAKRQEGVEVSLTPPDPEPVPLTAEELLDAGRIQEAREVIAATQAELDADPSAQAAQQRRELEAQNADLGQAVRELAEERVRAEQLDDAVGQLIEDIEDIESDLIEYDEQGAPEINPELVQRVAQIVEAGATREQLQELLDMDEDVMRPIFEGIQKWQQTAAAHTQQSAEIDQAMAEQAHMIEGTTEWIRLANLNPHLDIDRARQYFEGMEYKTPEEGQRAALNSFKLVAAEQEAWETTERNRQINIAMYAKGDPKYYDEVFLPGLAKKAFDDPATYGAQYRELTSPAAIDLDAALGNTDELGRLPGETRADAIKRPGGAAAFMERVLGKMDEMQAKDDDYRQQVDGGVERSKRHNMEKYGTPEGSHTGKRR